MLAVRLIEQVGAYAGIAAIPGLAVLSALYFSQARDVTVVTRLWNRAVLAFLGAMVGLMSVGLLAIKGGPPLAGTTSLYQFFGYFGLFCATVLTMRVIVAVLRDGLN